MSANEPTENTTLESWKEIAAYLNRDVRTVSRWEKEEGLPVHRHRHGQRASVYAYPQEIDAWRAGRKVEGEEQPSRAKRVWAIAAVAAAIGLAIWFGPFLNPPNPLVEASGAQLRQIWTGEDVDVIGSVSPDGKRLSYVHWETGDLAVRNLETGENRLLTGKTQTWGPDDSFAHLSLFSPAGDKLLYVWFRAEAERSEYELRLVDVDAEDPASTVQTVYRHDELKWPNPYAWTPDRDRVLTAMWRKDNSFSLGFVSIADGTFQAVKSGGWGDLTSAALSPDGKWVAVSASPQRGGDRDIFVLASDGSSLRTVVEHPGLDELMAWTPEGDILFRSDRRGQEDLWLLHIEDGRAIGEPAIVHSSASVARAVHLAADGTFYFAKRAGDRNIYTAEVDWETGKVIQEPEIAIRTHMGHNLLPSWSPDGKTLAYLSARSNADYRGATNRTLVFQPWPQGQLRELQLGFERMGRPTWAPDSSGVVFGTREEGEQGFYWLAAGSNTPKRIGDGDHYQRPDFSADGKRLYSARSDEWSGENFSLRELDLESGEEKVLFPIHNAWRTFARSPDGHFFAIREHDRQAGITRLLVRDDKSGEERELVQADSGERIGATPAWTPDSNRIVFCRKHDETGVSTLWSVKPDGSGLISTGLSAKDVDPLNLEELSVHPDGRHIAYSAGKTRFEIWTLENFLPSKGATD